MKIFDKITDFYESKQPFVVYRKPNSDLISGFFQNDNSLHYIDNFSETGFVFAPFDASKKAILFPAQHSEFVSEKLVDSKTSLSKKLFLEAISNKNDHIKLVQKAIDEIQKGTFKKVVISRKEEVQLVDFDLINIYKKLLENYLSAFVYVWFHPKIGLWLGATPETLLKSDNLTFETMSLAGTQTAKKIKSVVWHQKELEEQYLVTNFIESQLKNMSIEAIINPTETIKAGNLYHLKTIITGTLDSKKNSFKALVEALHPTPAVCGLPRENAKKFITEFENYDREYYTGFLGELNMSHPNLKTNTSMLFVNLRCMKITDNTANLFIGGGITKDSNPEKEWQETVSKSKTMKLVL